MNLIPEVSAIKEKLQQNAVSGKIAALYLYGSAVQGRLRIDSDIDIALLASYEVDAAERLALISVVESVVSRLLREGGFRQEISVADLRGKYMSISLQYKIITEGMLVYEGDRGQRIDFENAVKGEYFDFVPFLKYLRRRKRGNILQKT
ncbi:MAG TPA: nucleotidyltransferase domain-containing protein [Dissulfurispiraceae bacterium]